MKLFALCLLLALIAVSGLSAHAIWQFSAKQAEGYAGTELGCWILLILHIGVSAGMVAMFVDKDKKDL